MLPAQNLQVVAQGLAKLTDAYRNLPKISGLTKAVLLSSQELENVFWTILNGVNLNPMMPPTGKNLENIAAILNISRNGLTDVQLWTEFKLKLLALRSRGRSEDILQLSNAVTPTTIQEFATASMALYCYNVLTDGFDFATHLNLLGQAKDGGARLTVYYTTWPAVNTLLFNTRRSPALTTLPFSSRYSMIPVGGLMSASVQVSGVE